MKQRTAILSIFLVFVLQMSSALMAKSQSAPASPDNGTSRTSALSADARLWFVAGYNKGVADGIEFAESSKSGLDGKEVLPQSAMVKLRLHNAARMEGSRQRSNGEIIDEMSLFYKDFRNTPVCWDHAEQVAELTLLAGPPSEADLDALRREDAKKGCQ